ncbi:hypothetical protein GCM10009628_11150 [Paeniglutamicibacter kerguelensis]|uniref:Transposase IS701-like DDE domain-containing protein n=1 Tax=Paeniglutamicibacter kerguelensis TaxID=254788 RepID=A0ABS4XCU4_9MICC|nr:hypothetical protein [Paeniglutamicibacter kerguelensis]
MDRAADRRAKAQIPDTVRHRPKWKLALEMIDDLARWGCSPQLLVMDAGCGECGPFRSALTERGIPHVASVKNLAARHENRPGNPDAPMTGRFAALRVRPSNRNIPQDCGALPVEWLVAQWPEDSAEPTDYSLSTLPTGTRWPNSCGWRRSGGGSSTTTANSSTAWTWTTLRA